MADYLARVVETPDGRRPWKLELEIQEWVDARAKARLRDGERWMPADSASARSKAKSGVKTLLHYAQSIGWLQPGETGFSNAIHTYAPEWHHVVLHWRARLARREGERESSIRVGIQTLALYATRQGSTDPRTTDWDAVLDEIEADHKAKGLQTYQRQAARWVWRRIHLLSRVRELSTSQEQRVALVPQQAAKRVVASIATAWSAADIDFGGWVNEDGVPLSGLVEGPYGLRQWVWFTAGSVVGVAGDKKLPPAPMSRRTDGDQSARGLRRSRYKAVWSGCPTSPDGPLDTTASSSRPASLRRAVRCRTARHDAFELRAFGRNRHE